MDWLHYILILLVIAAYFVGKGFRKKAEQKWNEVRFIGIPHYDGEYEKSAAAMRVRRDILRTMQEVER